jgi:hypothetical protein
MSMRRKGITKAKERLPRNCEFTLLPGGNLDPFYINLLDYMTGCEEISATIMTGIFESIVSSELPESFL